MLKIVQIRAYTYQIIGQKNELLSNESASESNGGEVVSSTKTSNNTDIPADMDVDWSEFPDYTCQEAALRCMTNIMYKSSKISTAFCENDGLEM